MHLHEIFQLQDKLNSRFGWSQKELLALPEEERLSRIRDFVLVTYGELDEVGKAAGSKWWKKPAVDWDHLKEEIVDVLHFVVSLALAAGMDADELFSVYKNKNLTNHQRKDWKINREPPIGTT